MSQVKKETTLRVVQWGQIKAVSKLVSKKSFVCMQHYDHKMPICKEQCHGVHNPCLSDFPFVLRRAFVSFCVFLYVNSGDTNTVQFSGLLCHPSCSLDRRE